MIIQIIESLRRSMDLIIFLKQNGIITYSYWIWWEEQAVLSPLQIQEVKTDTKAVFLSRLLSI